MYCKFCGAELEENTTLCAGCGKDNKEEPAKKTSVWKIVVAVICCVALLAALVAMVYYGLYGTLKPRANNAQYKDNYTVSEEKLADKLDEVVATMGESKLTNRMLQLYYWMHVYNYGGYYDADLSKPLDKQVMDEDTGMTWQQYFLECALISWQQYQALTLMAEEAGYTMPQEYQDVLDGLEAEAKENAESGGFASVEELMASDFGAGVSFEDYANYFRMYYIGNLYFSKLVEEQQITQEEMDAYFAENGASLKTNWGIAVTKDMGKLVDVRHVLIQPEGGTTDEETQKTTYTDAEWEACRVKAQTLYDEWLAGDATEDTFYDLAYENSADGNYNEGGLYTDISKGIMVTEFENWCFDESRKEGDHGMVKTDFGYHIMYFVGSGDGYERCCRDGVLSQKADKMLQDILAENAVEANYKAMVLSPVELSGN